MRCDNVRRNVLPVELFEGESVNVEGSSIMTSKEEDHEQYKIDDKAENENE